MTEEQQEKRAKLVEILKGWLRRYHELKHQGDRAATRIGCEAAAIHGKTEWGTSYICGVHPTLGFRWHYDAGGHMDFAKEVSFWRFLEREPIEDDQIITLEEIVNE